MAQRGLQLLLGLLLSVPFALQVGHMKHHLETSERALQERIQRLEGVRLGLEEVSGTEAASHQVGTHSRGLLPDKDNLPGRNLHSCLPVLS